MKTKILLSIIIIYSVCFTSAAQVLNVSETFQEQNQWCWAGCSSCILKYNCTPVPQCNIAEFTRSVSTWFNFGTTNCCADPSQGCNNPNMLGGYAGSLQDILVHFANIQNHGEPGCIDNAAIHATLQQNRPFVVHWGWTSGGGHVVVGHGLVANDIYYMDPWFSEGFKIADRDWMCTGSNHTWIATEILTTSPESPWPAGNIAGASVVRCETSVPYYVAPISNAASYVWTVTPSQAGTLDTNANTAVFHPDPTYSGTAELQVQGISPCNTGVASAPFTIQFSKVLPGQTTTPTGPTVLCAAPANTQYSTTLITDINSYVWDLSPAGAGTVTGSTRTATVEWNNTFTGIASLTVKGHNSCGDGPTSDPLKISIGAVPASPGTPTGKASLCVNPANEQYSTTGSSIATSYFWELSPPDAGSITPNGTSAVVDWSNTFTGTATIIVTGRNACGDGVPSLPLSVSISTPPQNVPVLQGPVMLCAGVSKSAYSIAAPGTQAFLCTITPIEAGAITSSGDSAFVTWNPAFTGSVTISAKQHTGCGDGPASNPLRVFINAGPGSAELPTGTTNICQGSSPTSYTTKTVANATAYVWSILPVEAGTLTGTGTSCTVHWSTQFTGDASIIVQGQNDCGNGVASPPLTVKVGSLPVKTAMPSGTTVFCTHPTTTGYITGKTINAISYKWILTPASAGNISGTDTSALVTWNPSFNGTVTIKVSAVNTCGEGPASDPSTVTLNPLPDKPAIPTGESALCEGGSATVYTASGIFNATSYAWTLSPSNAGTVTSTSNTASVQWNPQFTGTALIAVQARNDCGDGPVSDPLKVTIKAAPAQAPPPVGEAVLCAGIEKTVLTTKSVLNALSYEWALTPAEAGTISGSNTSATVTWNPSFIGAAMISVKARNDCGDGPASNPFTVNIRPLPIVALGSDTGITVADTLILNAGSGFQRYEWNDNSNRQTMTIVGSLAGAGVHQYFVNVATSDGCSASDTIVVSIKDITGVEQFAKENVLYVYPNPASGAFTIMLPDANAKNSTIEIFTIDGKSVFSTRLEQPQQQIQLSGLPKGMYMMKYSSGTNIRVVKLIMNN